MNDNIQISDALRSFISRTISVLRPSHAIAALSWVFFCAWVPVSVQAQNPKEARILPGDWLEITANATSTRLEISSKALPNHVDEVIGIQLQLKSELFAADGSTGITFDGTGSWLFSSAGIHVILLEEPSNAHTWIRITLPSGSVTPKAGKVLDLDFSAVFPNGLDEETLRSLEGGGGCIIILVDLM